LLEIEWLALACVEGVQAGIDIGAQLAQLLDMREELAPNFFLIGVRQASHLGDGVLQGFDHA
jgi:hypothetical protein